jgi:hypothetical protein
LKNTTKKKLSALFMLLAFIGLPAWMFDTVVRQGNTTITGTLNVSGASTLSSGGSLSGTFAGNPTFSGNVTATAGQNTLKAYNFNTVIWLDGVKYTSLAAAYADIPTATYSACSDAIGTCWTGGGGVVEVPPGWIDPAWAANLVLKNNASIHFNGPAYFNQGSFQVTMAHGLEGISIVNPYGDHTNRTSGVTFDYSGSSDAWAIGDGTSFVNDIRIENIQIHCIDGGNACNPLHVHSAEYSHFINLDLVCANAAANTGNGLLFDGATTSNYQNELRGIVVNFCNAPWKFTGTNQDNTIYGDGGSVGNPHGTAGIAYDIGGTSIRNIFIHPQILTSSAAFTTLMTFGNSASGNQVFADNGNGLVSSVTVAFGSSSNNIYYCLAGSCTYTDSGTSNQVINPNLFTKVHLTAQGANIGTTTLLAVPSSTTTAYRVHVYAAETRAATVSSTMVSVVIGWTDPDSNTAVTFTTAPGTPGGNVINNPSQTDAFLTFVIQAKAGTNITYQTTNYATSGATSMQYALTVTVEPVPN